MDAWAGLAIAQGALVVLSLWRLSRATGRRPWWPGIAVFAVASLAIVVMARGGTYASASALFGTAVLAADAIFLGGVLVTSLCTRSEAELSGTARIESP
ncbi:MAG TPA: hypothetical protein VK427_24830 [Kofleriaceae bacterium]|nr:hypothetical protein [Kofleriaceae bacterium]